MSNVVGNVARRYAAIHKTLGCTPAMEAEITKSVWMLEDLLRA